MTRITTIIPLSIVAGLYIITANSQFEEEDDYKRDSLSSSDFLYTGTISYLAGVHEEALFRGWVMPVLMEWTDSPFWSNTLTSVGFSLAHLGSVDVPVVQLLLGWYLGYVSQSNQWTLSESIFIHAWWDVFALLGMYSIKRKDSKAKLPILWLPQLKFVF